MRGLYLAPLLLLTAAGCAARSGAVPAARLLEAGRLASAGCYTCLLEAGRIYDEALARRPSAAVQRAAFRTAILLALREKELGLPANPHLERARQLAGGLAPADDPELVLAIADAAPWDHAGWVKEAYEEFVRTKQAHGPLREEWHARLAGRLDDPFFAYLEVALACQTFRDFDARLEPVLARHPSSALVQYRAGMCSSRQAEWLKSTVASDPRFVEARFFLGRFTLAAASFGKTSRREAVPDLTAAYEAFPTSPAVTFAMAGLYRALNRLPDALRYYDQTLALAPAHREALVGRTIALSHLGRYPDGVASATRILDLGQWYLGDAYYWRAFNYLNLKDLDRARDDIEQAKTASPISADAFTLAGMIYFERRELDTAAADLIRAIDLSRDNCTAMWYLGLVRAEQKDWTPAAETFESAAPCYRSTADLVRAQLAELQRTLGPGEERDEVERDYATIIDENLTSEARALFNVAYARAQLRQFSDALAFAERAAAHDAMRTRAADLIAAINKAMPR